MNQERQPPANPDDFDRPPEPELAALFAASAPAARPVDVAGLVVPKTFRDRTFNWRNPMFRRTAALVSLTAGVAAVAALFVLFGSSPKISFAQVKEQIAKTQSMTCKSTITVPGKPAETVRIAALSSGLDRIDFPNGNYTVMDRKSGKALCVLVSEKKATVMVGLPVTPAFNVYEIFHNLVSEKSARLPDEVIDGRKVSVFQVEPPDQVRKQPGGESFPPMKVWVNGETRLPIRAEMIGKEVAGRAVMHDFVFDEPLGPALFSLDPPQGYKVTTLGQATLLPAPKTQDLLAPKVEPGVGLGPVTFGMTRDEVVKILGKPDSEEGGLVDYPSRGYSFAVSPVRGVILIQCFSQQTRAFDVRDFAGKTKEGIGIRSTREDLEKAFGKPDSVDNYGPKAAHAAEITYNKLGLRLTLYSDKIVSIWLEGPRQ